MKKFLITEKDVEAIDAVIHHIRENIKAGIYPTVAAKEEAMEVMSGLLTVIPKMETV